MMLHEALKKMQEDKDLRLTSPGRPGILLNYEDAYYATYTAFGVLREDWDLVKEDKIIDAAVRFMMRRSKNPSGGGGGGVA